MSILSDSDRLQLQKMVDANQAEDNTNTIRKLKHSSKIREEVNLLIDLKERNKKSSSLDVNDFSKLTVEKCKFLFNNYTDLYNKVLKEEIDMKILYKFIDVLGEIEDGKVNQHEGSVLIGELLKSIYIDSALRKSKKLDNKYDNDKNKKEKIIEPKKINWADYKRQYTYKM